MSIETTADDTPLVPTYDEEQIPPEAKVCETHGEYLSKPIQLGFGGAPIWTRCEKCVRAEREASESKSRNLFLADQQRRMVERFGDASIPKRLEKKGFENYLTTIPAQVSALAKIREYLAQPDGRILVLSGETGTGKTHLAAAAVAQSLQRTTAMYTTAMGIVRMVRETWGKESGRTEADVYRSLSQVGLLVIDEIGAGYQGDGEKVVLNEVIDIRYREMMPTILVTNLGGESFKDLMGERVIDRLHECGIWVGMKWPSHRRGA